MSGEGPREWTIYVCPVCDGLHGGPHIHEHEVVHFKRERVREVGVSPEPRAATEMEKRVLAYTDAGWVHLERVGDPRLSREEIEALLYERRGGLHHESARAKLRARLEGQQDG